MATQNGNTKSYTTQQSLNCAIWSICDIMRRSNCAGALQYVPELTWMLFLRILDEREAQEAAGPRRWGAASPLARGAVSLARLGAPDGRQAYDLQQRRARRRLRLRQRRAAAPPEGLRNRPNATPRQKVISEIMSGVERVRMDTERNLLDVLDKVDASPR